MFTCNNNLFVWIAAVLLSGMFCAVSAMANVNHPEAYKQLTAIEMAPEHTPRYNAGVYALASGERRYQERLPIQLSGAMKKIERTKYRHSSKRR